MLDQVILIAYILITLLVGLYVGRSTKTLEDYAIGSRNFSTVALVATIFASVVDAGLTTGLVSSIFNSGPIFLLAFSGIIFANISISLFIAPKMKPFLGLISSGDIFEKLYGKKAKTLMGFSTIIESTLTSAVQILAISQMCKYFFNIPPILASIVVSFIILLYTFRGGIRSVTATDVFQFGVMIIAIPIMCSFAITKAGGLSVVADKVKGFGLFFPTATNNDLGQYISVFISFSLPCLYPLCIQRMLMAKNTRQLSRSFLINGLLSLPFYLTIGVIGIVGYLLYPEADSNQVFSVMVNEILPVGAKGLVLAGMIAIFMSTVDSILNIGSLAIIHDVLGSMGKIKNKNEIKFMRLASFIIACGAIVICHLFPSIMDILFFLMVLGNSVFFPGFFWGILGYKASPFGFWLGVVSGISTIVICIVFFNIFPLTIMLIAISINSSILLIDYLLENSKEKILDSRISFKNEHFFTLKAVRRFLFSNQNPINQEYYTIFFICAVVISLFPFFFSAALGLEKFDPIVQTIGLITSSISFFMIFRQQWWFYVDKLFPVIWLVSVTLVLPTQSFYMFFISNFSLVWLLDSILIMLLLYLITSTSGFILSFLVGVGFSCLISIFGNVELAQNVANDFGYWAIVLHVLVIIVCLVMFRKKDHEAYNLAQKTLSHEADRSFRSFEQAAKYLETILPKLINNIKLTNPEEASKLDLQALTLLPSYLHSTAYRSRYIVKQLTFFTEHERQNIKVFDIVNSINDAINDTSIKSILKAKINIIEKQKLLIKGDQDQITQVLLNLLENAIHAIRGKLIGEITITLDNNSVIVKDNGIGIKRFNLPNIFDEDFSTKGTSGQGLVFCKRVIENHSSSISCASEVDHFTEFTLDFTKIKVN